MASENPIAKIARGLDTLEARKRAAPFKFESLQNAPKTTAEVHARAIKAMQARDRLRVLATQSSDKIEAYKVEAKATFADFGRSRDENNVIHDDLGDTRRQAMITREVNKFAREVRAELAEDRNKALAELKAHCETLEAVSASYASPVTRLNIETLSDPKRAVYAATLANAGPTAVEEAMREAMVTGNLAMAAAASDRYEGLSKAGKAMVRFARSDPAFALLGETWRQSVEALGLVEIALVEGELAFMGGEGKRTTPDELLKIGRMKSELVEKIGRPLKTEQEKGQEDEHGNIPGETLSQKLDRKYKSGPLPPGYTFLIDDKKGDEK